MTTSTAGVRSVVTIRERRGEQAVAGMGNAPDRSATLRPDGAVRGHGGGLGVVPDLCSATVAVVLLLVASCLTSLWKVNLPIPLASGYTLSVSYAANLMALLLLGPEQALVIALAGVWTQCSVHVRRRYPWYRTAFSMPPKR